jgi:predicted GNAT family acetyltransferase
MGSNLIVKPQFNAPAAVRSRRALAKAYLMATSDYAIRDNVEQHRFETDLGDGSIAMAEYNLLEGKIVFTHTQVPTAHEGKGIGSALIRFALRSARERGLQVIPICPFFAAYIKKHEEEQDLLDPAYRKALGLG